MSVQLSLPRLTLLERRRFQHTLNVMLPTPLDIKNSSFSSYVCTPTMSVTFPSSPTQDTNSSRFLQSCLLSVCLSVCLCVCVCGKDYLYSTIFLSHLFICCWLKSLQGQSVFHDVLGSNRIFNPLSEVHK